MAPCFVLHEGAKVFIAFNCRARYDLRRSDIRYPLVHLPDRSNGVNHPVEVFPGTVGAFMEVMEVDCRYARTRFK